ncbi:hypothetical protein [Sorangium sp. So ce513]|uniref:hypothetical protein n=1 Tax=Sorangium sp. So ce513 TaxID=3133315 RepID=UPI003F63BED8
MLRFRDGTCLLWCAAALAGGVAVGCGPSTEGGGDGGAASATTSGVGGGGGATSASASSAGGEGGTGGSGGASSAGGDGGTGASGGVGGSGGEGGTGGGGGEGGSGGADVSVNPCGSGCGPDELCDESHLGLDDDCDGEVDETCTCIAGQARACFRGDPSYRTYAGCFPGTQICGEDGTWGPCEGGLHAADMCFLNDESGCHPLYATPFTLVDLKEGTGTFSDDAGFESWRVECPEGVDPCPEVGGMDPRDDFRPLQSGEYTVTYTKRALEAGGTTSCKYPLFVGARGLRVELEWEHGEVSADLDLHLHQPGNTEPWAIAGSPASCGWDNCTVESLAPAPEIRWFSDEATPPDPVNWYLDPVESNNTCYFVPRGVGEMWRELGAGCHNPRLDLDNIECDPGVTDPEDIYFCAPENINIDFPPRGQWTRIGVHYFGHGRGVVGDIHPRIKVFCDGALGAELGPKGFHLPEQPVTFTPADAEETFWIVADVIFPEPDACGERTCIVQPLYADEALRTPLLVTTREAETSLGPAYPPVP